MPTKLSTLEDRVYLQRVRLFFGNTIGNLVSAVIGGFFISLILNAADVPIEYILTWFSLLIFFALITGLVENRYSQQPLTIQNASKWVNLRSIAGSFVGLMYGITPFVFSNYLGVQEEMFLFIALSAMISIALVGYSAMPHYYILLNIFTMMPLSIYFFTHSDAIHIILGFTALMWQFLVLSKGWRVSKNSIEAISLNEKLQEEIEHHKQTKEQLQKLATHDALTGIPNRRLLMENLDSMVSLARRNGKKIIVMFIDLDGFKDVNDSHGHESGDLLLRKVAERLKNYIRKSDTLARIGGDEFVLAFSEADDIDLLATRIIESICEAFTLPNGSEMQVGASIGVSLFPDDADSIEELIRISDNRMYVSKDNGKNRYTFHE